MTIDSLRTDDQSPRPVVTVYCCECGRTYKPMKCPTCERNELTGVIIPQNDLPPPGRDPLTWHGQP